MAEKVSAEDRKELDILFPIRKVEIVKGFEISVRPISLEDLPQVLDSIVSIARKLESGMHRAELAVMAAKEIVQIIPFCIDVPMKSLPAHAAPGIIDAIIDLNITEESSVKLKALVDRLLKLGEKSQGLEKSSLKQ